MKTTYRFTLLILGISIVFSCNKPKINSEITEEELFAHVDFLASDSLQGRLPGTPYDRVAAKYIKDQMEISQFILLEKKGYQFFSFITHQEAGSANSLIVGTKKCTFGKDYTAFPFSSSDTLSSSVVFAGLGFSIHTDSLTWDDYQSVNVSGKWAMMFRGDPDYQNPKSIFIQHSDDRHKAMVAKDHGAAGVILVSGVEFDAEDALVNLDKKSFDIGIPVILLKRDVAEIIVKTGGHGLKQLEQKLISGRSPVSFSTAANVSARTDIVNKTENSQNVVGLIEGSHPTLKNQYIVLGAHYDHLGTGGKESTSRMPDSVAIHNGADDNASGVAAILEIGQKFVAKKPMRSIVIVAFGAEEMGLIGSRYFVDNPLIPVDSISAMINFDMLGRLNEKMNVQVGGTKTSAEVEEILSKFDSESDISLSYSPEGYGPSDHASFYNKDVPVLYFTTGPHVDYHTPFDKTERINFSGLLSASTLIYQVVAELANKPEMLTFQEAGPKFRPTRHGKELKVRLGIMPDVSSSGTDGLLVLAVTENMPAWFAGIQKNDRITSINGKKVGNIQDYMFRLNDLKPGNTVSVELVRDNQLKVVLVQL